MPEPEAIRITCPQCHGDKWRTTPCLMCGGKLTVEGCGRCSATGLVPTPLVYGGTIPCPDCSGYGSKAAREVHTKRVANAAS